MTNRRVVITVGALRRIAIWVWLVIGAGVGVMSGCGRTVGPADTAVEGADANAGQTGGGVAISGGPEASTGDQSAGGEMSTAGGGGGGSGPCGGPDEPCCTSGQSLGCEAGLECNLDEHCKVPDPCDGSDRKACVDLVAGEKGDFGTPLESSWFIVGCLGRLDKVCLNSSLCPNGNAASFEDRGDVILQTFPVGGVPGQHYKVTFTFNAIAAAKVYQDGTRDQGNALPVDFQSVISDTFYRDGSPVVSNAEPWKLTVFDENGAEARHFYMNSFPPTSLNPNFFGESDRTYLLSYTKSIVVIGGGKVSYLIADSNCQVNDNCGPGQVQNNDCRAPRNIPNEPADTMLPAQYMHPTTKMLVPTADLSAMNDTAAQPWHAQLGHLTITAAEKTDQPVNHDFL